MWPTPYSSCQRLFAQGIAGGLTAVILVSLIYPGVVPVKDKVFGRNPLQGSNQVLILKINGAKVLGICASFGAEPVSLMISPGLIGRKDL